MSDDELIAKAREHAEVFESGGNLPIRVAQLPKSRVQATTLIYFGSNDRDEVVEILLDSETGDFISAKYSPPPPGT